MTKIPSVEEVVEAIRQRHIHLKGNNPVGFVHLFADIKKALTSEREAGAREVELTHFVWCPQCGDALEQTGTQNKYNCFGCDTDYQLKALTPPTK